MIVKKKILAIDDDPFITKIIKNVLEETGRYEVQVVNHSHEAIATIRSLMPDLIIIDVMMPPPLGSEIAAQLNEDPQLKALKYVFLTGVIEKIDPQLPGAEIGGHSFLSKPIYAEQLINFVDAKFDVDK